MNRYRRLAVACLVSAGVSVGCTSAPVRYYTLTPPPGEMLPASKAVVEVEVRVIHTPPQLNRVELMVRTGPTEVALLENERWASPVKDEIKDAVRLELQRRLRSATGSPTGISKMQLDIDVQHFEAELGRHALLEASWSLTLSPTRQGSNDPQAVTCGFRADEKISAGYEGIVKGYQREIAALADAVVAETTRRASGKVTACQPADGSSDSPTRG
jgi:uncharacterized lipoprotein YmbA